MRLRRPDSSQHNLLVLLGRVDLYTDSMPSDESKSLPLTKEQIVKGVWAEEYNPLVHDTRIYTNFHRLRGILIEHNLTNSLLAFDGTYRLMV